VRAWLAAVIVVIGVGACSQAATHPTHSPSPALRLVAPPAGFLPSPPIAPLPSAATAELKKAYGFVLGTHCGVQPFDWAGKTWYPNAPTWSNPGGLPRDWDPGTIAMSDEHHALFTDSRGFTLDFLDQPDAVVGRPYGVNLWIAFADGTVVSDPRLGGANWYTDQRYTGPLPSPAATDPSGQVVIGGLITLAADGTAVFRSADGHLLTFRHPQFAPCA